MPDNTTMPDNSIMSGDALAAAPFRSRVMKVEDEWIDYNGHLNMAYYHVLFDRAVDEVHEAVGLGAEYRKATDASTFTAEAHIVYLREIHAGDEVVVTTHMLDTDEKRTHSFHELIHAREGFVSAVSEQLHLHVDLTTKSVAPFPDAVQRRLKIMREAHASLERSFHVGRVIGIRRK